MSQRPRVALWIDMSNLHGRRILEGVTRYLRSHRAWTIILDQRGLDRELPGWFGDRRVDGVISRWGGPGVSRMLRELGTAVVDVSSRHPPSGFPRITTDDHAVVRMAAEHLLERCFPSFAFYGLKDDFWSTCRRDGFIETVARAKKPVQVFEIPSRGRHHPPGEREMVRLGRWLESLPKPAGVMVCKDLHGPYIVDACQRSGLRIPEEVAVIGADDDTLLCEMTDPPLSSVICNPGQIGFEAASLLDHLMEGGEVAFETTVIPPVGVATRLSSDVLAVDDTRVIDAVRYIHAHACHGIKLGDVLGHVSTSRTTLDRQFRKHLHRTPQADIRAVRLRRAKQLLSETGHSIHRIAGLVGFEHAEYFYFAFKREFSTTPARFREESRSAKP
jgi:LacI family transcriptional regulator